MPLHIAKTVPLSPDDISDQLVVFYSSVVDGNMWCSDCAAIDGLIKAAFEPASSPSALIIYVGDRPTWEDPANIFRGEPWKISSIPTVIKLRDHKEEARFVEGDIIDGISPWL